MHRNGRSALRAMVMRQVIRVSQKLAECSPQLASTHLQASAGSSGSRLAALGCGLPCFFMPFHAFLGLLAAAGAAAAAAYFRRTFGALDERTP